jgi:hypothetical protein
VLEPLTALRPVAAEAQPRAPRAPGAADARGAARSGGAGSPPGADPRSQFANGRALVSVIGADGQAAEREVKVGVMNRVSAQIVSGLEPGEKVVIGARIPAAVAKAPTGSSLVPTGAQGGGRP